MRALHPILLLVTTSLLVSCDGLNPDGRGQCSDPGSPPAGSLHGSVATGGFFDFSEAATADAAGQVDLWYSAHHINGPAAPCGTSGQHGENQAYFEERIADRSFLPTPGSWHAGEVISGSSCKRTIWVKTRERRYAMIFTREENDDRLDFFYVYPYGAFTWSDSIAPVQPSLAGVVPTNDAGTLQISWQHSPSTDVLGYTILYGRTEGSYTLTNDPGYATDFSLRNLTSGVLYYIRVVAYDHEGNRSEYSNVLAGTPR